MAAGDGCKGERYGRDQWVVVVSRVGSGRRWKGENVGSVTTGWGAELEACTVFRSGPRGAKLEASTMG